MLSRAADRMYWFGRYMERVENTALLLQANTSLALDLPYAGHVWGSLVSVAGDQQGFSRRYATQSELNVVRFLAQTGPASIRHSLWMARENARASREMLPGEAWPKINRLHHYLERHLAKALRRQGRHALLSQVGYSCQELRGYLASSMSVSAPYNFILLGRHLERADMTTRIVDVGCLSRADSPYPGISEYDDILWMNVLQSLSAYEMYRQHVDNRLNGADVAGFLLGDPLFPRSARHSLERAKTCCAQIPRHREPLRRLTAALELLEKANLPRSYQAGRLHAFIDGLQLALAQAQAEITQTWFGPPP